MNGSVNVDGVVSVAMQLCEACHYGAERIACVSSQLQEDWKGLTSVLEERSNTLVMSTDFHQGAEQFLGRVEGWCEACADDSLPAEMAELEASIQQHQTLYDEITSAYTQVLDWVEQHGEVFLNKHTGVGKSLHRARALQKRHDDFQQVAQPVLKPSTLGVACPQTLHPGGSLSSNPPPWGQPVLKPSTLGVDCPQTLHPGGSLSSNPPPWG
eukprot:XP_014040144.1 PREDICTED: triple functional domain protein-like [Salmo salar]